MTDDEAAAAAEHAGIERMRAHIRGVFDQAATDAARAAGDVPREGRTTAYDDLRDPAHGDRVRLVYAYAHDGWWLGELQATRRRGEQWEGHVVWTEGIGKTYADWLPAERIQRGPSDGGGEGQV